MTEVYLCPKCGKPGELRRYKRGIKKDIVIHEKDKRGFVVKACDIDRVSQVKGAK